MVFSSDLLYAATAQQKGSREFCTAAVRPARPMQCLAERQTSGQRILMKGRIAGAIFFTGTM